MQTYFNRQRGTLTDEQKQRDRETERQRQRQSERHKYRQTDRQTDDNGRERDKENWIKTV